MDFSFKHRPETPTRNSPGANQHFREGGTPGGQAEIMIQGVDVKDLKVNEVGEFK